MRGLDQRAIEEYGIPGIVLMENAALGVVRHMEGFCGDPDGKRVLVVCGPGNNGGDGMAVARHLANRGARVEIVFLNDPESYSGDAAINRDIVRAMNIPATVAADDEAAGALAESAAAADIIVDAIFGTGLKRPLAGRFALAVETINQRRAAVVAVDIPSGLNSDTGAVLGTAVRAGLTVTFGLAKIGHFTGQGPELCGAVEVVDISIPAAAAAQAETNAILLDDGEIAPMIPARPRTGHKGTFGHLLIIAGSRGKTGAGILAARGAAASGCGLVSVAVPWDLNPVFEAALIEPMTIPLPASTDGRPVAGDLDLLLKAAEERRAVVVGPGIGAEKDTAELVLALAGQCEKPMVIDADGLNIIAAAGGLRREHATVLTPHPGEMARLLGSTTAEIQENRPEAARRLAAESGAVVVLKGAGTVIAHPDGRLAVNPTGSPLLAAGGSGDVLAGIIGGLMAQGADEWSAACLGTYVHGLASQSLGCGQDRGVPATKLCEEIGPLFSYLTES